MVICLERGADLHMVQLMLLPLTVSCFSKIQIGFTFLVPAHLGSPGKRVVKRVCVCVHVYRVVVLRVRVYNTESISGGSSRQNTRPAVASSQPAAVDAAESVQFLHDRRSRFSCRIIIFLFAQYYNTMHVYINTVAVADLGFLEGG